MVRIIIRKGVKPIYNVFELNPHSIITQYKATQFKIILEPKIFEIIDLKNISRPFREI